MLETVIVTKTLSAPADNVWEEIKGVGGLDRWFPIIAACRVEGAGVGAVRIMTLANGDEMRDRITEIDTRARRLRYERPHHPFPVTDYRGAVEIRDDGPTQSVLTWRVRFEVPAAHRDDMVRLIESAISDGVDGLHRELRSARRLTPRG